MKCEYCGSELNSNSKICGCCGAPNPNYNDVVASSTNPIKEARINSFASNSNVNSNYYSPSTSKENTKVMVVIIGVMCVAIIVLMIAFGITEKDRERGNNSGIFSSAEDYVATYDGGEITKEEFAVYYYLYGDYYMDYSEDDTEAVEGIILQEVEEEILYNKAKSVVSLTQEQIDYLDYYFDDETKEYIKGENLDSDTVRDIYERDYYIQNYVEKESAEYTDEDVLDYLKTTYGDDVDLNEYNVQIIYYNSEQSAQTMLNNLKDGANFDEMAKFSEDEERLEENGMVTCYDDGQTSDEFISAIKTLEKEQIYDGVLEFDNGYCVVRMVSVVENGRVNNPSDKEDLFYEIFESELDLSDAYYYEEVAKEVIDSLNQ